MSLIKLPLILLNTYARSIVLTPPNPTPDGDEQGKWADNNGRKKSHGVLIYIGIAARVRSHP